MKKKVAAAPAKPAGKKAVKQAGMEAACAKAEATFAKGGAQHPRSRRG